VAKGNMQQQITVRSSCFNGSPLSLSLADWLVFGRLALGGLAVIVEMWLMGSE
jgi:hypothetical protein